MRKIVVALTLVLAACDPSASNKAGGDKATSQFDLCTTPDCADSPCTPGCRFLAKQGNCPCDAPSAIQASRVVSCSGRCGLRSSGSDDTSLGDTGYCWKYDAGAPGCTPAQGCEPASAACYPQDGAFDVGGASICAPDETCHDGGSADSDLNDAGVRCDMAMPDLTTPIDLATPVDLAQQGV